MLAHRKGQGTKGCFPCTFHNPGVHFFAAGFMRRRGDTVMRLMTRILLLLGMLAIFAA